MKISTLFAALAVLAGAQPALAGTRVLTLLTSQNSEAQAMSLILANQLLAGGNQVDVLLCGPAGDIVSTTPPEAALAPITPQGATVRKLTEMLLAKGGTISVCAIYLPNRKKTPDALMPGIAVASPKDIAALIADPAVKVMGQ
jgi:predicted peroxiredoxin